MKVNAFSVAAGLAGSLILSSAASAAFTGILTESRSPAGPVVDPTVPGPARTYFVCNIWASFSTASDRLLSVTQASITMLGGASLFQHGFGTSTAPNSALFGLAPALQYDSFVTVGLKSVPVGGTDSTSLEPGAAFSAAGFTGGWFNSNPDNDQGAPGAHGTPAGAVAGQFYVLIAQLTIANPGPTAGTQGQILVAWKPQGATDATFTSASWVRVVPTPGALALLGLAGLTSRRRRA